MSNRMTAEERAECVISGGCYCATRAYAVLEQPCAWCRIRDQILEAERAAAEEMRSACEAVVGSAAEIQYQNDPGFSICMDLERRIRQVRWPIDKDAELARAFRLSSLANDQESE